ncbi:MAG TPA: hypothetical protein PLJ66_04570 [Methanofastidiosum sp.]|nr:hypothetical protein [Methanofastidiosum sp.]
MCKVRDFEEAIQLYGLENASVMIAKHVRFRDRDIQRIRNKKARLSEVKDNGI